MNARKFCEPVRKPGSLALKHAIPRSAGRHESISAPATPRCPCGGVCPQCSTEVRGSTPRVPSSPGEKLPVSVRRPFEAAFRADFSDVRIHTGALADQTVRENQARAFTLGTSIVFRNGALDLSSVAGRRLLGHELAHVVQARKPAVRSNVSVEEAEKDATTASLRAADGSPATVRVSTPANSPMYFLDRDELEDEARARRGYERTQTRRDLGGRRYWDLDRDSWRGGRGTQQPPTSEAATEAIVQTDVARLRPIIPEWHDAMRMGTFDSSFYGQRGPFNFRGRIMAGWEVNYYFISMALAHQGWDWNETQAVIWSWNMSQEAGVNPFGGDGEMTDEMWFAAREGFDDEHERLAAE